MPTTMLLQDRSAGLSNIRAFASPTHCPLCNDLMVAPYMSEFVEGGEIRHHWVCEECGFTSETAIPLTAE